MSSKESLNHPTRFPSETNAKLFLFSFLEKRETPNEEWGKFVFNKSKINRPDNQKCTVNNDKREENRQKPKSIDQNYA